MSTTAPEALLESLESSMSSPAASYLRTMVMERKKRQAIKVIQEESDFSDEDAARLYDYLKTMMKGGPVQFVELPKAEWLARAMDKEKGSKVRFMVRRGVDIFEAYPRLYDGEMQCWVQADLVPWMKLDQIWVVETKIISKK